jgi:hypothetical protein
MQSAYDFCCVEYCGCVQPYRGPPADPNSSSDGKSDAKLAGCGATGADEYGKFATNDTGNWNVCYMSLHNEQISAEISASNLNNMAVTSSLLAEAIPRDYHHCLFSAVSPGTHILPHHGPTNKKLRIHLPIVVPPVAEDVDGAPGWRRLSAEEQEGYDITREVRPCLRVHDQVIYFKEGKQGAYFVLVL